MRTSISTGKRLWGLGFAVAVLSALCGGVAEAKETRVAWDFEKYALGDYPRDFLPTTWKGPGRKTYAYVTNLRAKEGEKAFTVQQYPGGDEFGLTRQLYAAAATNGSVTVSFDYRREKRGDLQIEFAQGGHLKPYVALKEQLMLWGRKGSPKAYGKIESHRWYHVDCTFSLSPNAVPAGTVTVSDCETGISFAGEWPQSFIADLTKGCQMRFFFNASMSVQQLYLDNFEIVVREAE